MIEVKKAIISFLVGIALISVTACSGSEPEMSGKQPEDPQSTGQGAQIITESPSDTDTQKAEEDFRMDLQITVGGKTFSARLYDNEAARAFARRLPLTLSMSELNGNEKYYYLDESLPADSRRSAQIRSGDLMLYGSDCLVLFYQTFSTSYSYTPLGYLEDAAGLAEAVGQGRTEVSFQLAE